MTPGHDLGTERPAGGKVSRDTLLRQWALLKQIPRWPQRKSTAAIASALRDADHEVHVRSVQRDLARLSSLFHFSSETEGRAEYWFWPQHSEVLDLPSMDVPTAMAFLLSREHLRPLMPPSDLKLIGPNFTRAEEVLRQSPGAMAAWRERICVVTRGPRLQGAKVDDEVQAEVYSAVLHGRQLRIEYRNRRAQAAKEQLVHPLGLVIYDGVTYLIATAKDYMHPVMYAVHRMKSATALAESARRPAGFKLADYAADQFRFPVSEQKFKLVARFEPSAAAHLEERPLSQDQVIRDIDGLKEISATVSDTEDLRWWLLGFGDNVEVLRPAELRSDIQQRIVAAAKHYAKRRL